MLADVKRRFVGHALDGWPFVLVPLGILIVLAFTFTSTTSGVGGITALNIQTYAVYLFSALTPMAALGLALAASREHDEVPLPPRAVSDWIGDWAFLAATLGAAILVAAVSFHLAVVGAVGVDVLFMAMLGAMLWLGLWTGVSQAVIVWRRGIRRRILGAVAAYFVIFHLFSWASRHATMQVVAQGSDANPAAYIFFLGLLDPYLVLRGFTMTFGSETRLLAHFGDLHQQAVYMGALLMWLVGLAGLVAWGAARNSQASSKQAPPKEASS